MKLLEKRVFLKTLRKKEQSTRFFGESFDILCKVIAIQNEILKLQNPKTKRFYKICVDIPAVKFFKLEFKKGDQIILQGARVKKIATVNSEKELTARMIHKIKNNEEKDLKNFFGISKFDGPIKSITVLDSQDHSKVIGSYTIN